MRTFFANFINFSMESTNSFLNVKDIKDVKQWKRMLKKYHFLHNLGVVISKANRALVFDTLDKLNFAQKQLIELIENGGENDERDFLKQKIEALQSKLTELSSIKDEVVNEEVKLKPSLVTMIVFQYNKGKKLKSKKMLLEELSETKSKKRADRILELIALLENK